MPWGCRALRLVNSSNARLQAALLFEDVARSTISGASGSLATIDTSPSGCWAMERLVSPNRTMKIEVLKRMVRDCWLE